MGVLVALPLPSLGKSQVVTNLGPEFATTAPAAGGSIWGSCWCPGRPLPPTPAICRCMCPERYSPLFVQPYLCLIFSGSCCKVLGIRGVCVLPNCRWQTGEVGKECRRAGVPTTFVVIYAQRMREVGFVAVRFKMFPAATQKWESRKFLALAACCCTCTFNCHCHCHWPLAAFRSPFIRATIN